jgi:uncharacterized repeat protein (TIGR01451 family)
MRFSRGFLLFVIAGCSFGQNETAVENANAGTTNWQLTNPATNREIEGYASLTSVNAGSAISLFVSTSAPTYTMDIYRIGWYGGAGGRQMVSTISRTGVLQVTPSPDAFGTFDCNWTSPYVLNVPSTWVSGVYLAKLTASTGSQTYIKFVVREDARAATYLFQQSVNTDEAYNNWPGPNAGGKSLYTFNSVNGVAAVKVSFNRPFFIDSAAQNAVQVGAGFFLRWEIMMVRWMEKNSYDLSYCSDVDTHENLNILLSHKAFLIVGHDEYWSWQMRANVESARDSGVGLGFFASNVSYWQVRLEASVITGAADRIIVGYKANAASDPVTNPCLITGEWRTNSCKPSEQAFIGIEYTAYNVGCPATSNCGDIVISDASSWALAGTGLTNGAHLPALLGYEVDGRVENDSPPGTATIAHSPLPAGSILDTSTYQFSDVSTYVASSGATVFAVGSMQWTWALDDWGAPAQRPSALSTAGQKITANVLARLASGSVVASGPPQSDDFNTSSLNTNIWSFVNPVGDGSFAMTGTEVAMTVPAGSNHDPSSGGANSAARIIQRVSNTDFTIETKFDSIPSQQYTFEGLAIDQDASNYLRIEYGSTGSTLIVQAAAIVSGNTIGLLSATVTGATSSLWLRVQRQSATWTVSWSANGSTYQTLGSFTQNFTVNDLGPYAGNYNASGAPAFTAKVDYFHNIGQVSSAPDLTISKSHTGSFTQGQTGAAYSITVSNAGTAATSGTVTVADTVPTGLTAVSIAGGGWTCTQPAGPCTRSDALATAGAYPSLTVTVNVASNAPASVTNTGTVSGGGETNTSNNTASDPTTINTSGGGGSAPQSDDFNTSSLNTSLWNFVNAVGNGSFTMTGTQVSLTVPAGSNHDPSFGGTNSTAHIIQRVSNTDFTVETKFDSIPSQQYTFEGLTVEQDASNYLRMEFGSTGSTLIVQAASVLSGNTAALQSATVTGATSSLWLRVQRQGTTWTVSWSTNGTTYQALGAFTQSLTVTGIGPYAGNYNAVSPPAFTATVDYFHNVGQVSTAPDLAISNSHTGSFTQGQNGATYTITVSNAGNAPTSGTVTVADNLPTGLTAISIAGSGWNCTQPAGPCSRSDALASAGSYQPLTLAVNVASNAPSSVTNSAVVSGGGETNTSNDTANDPTTINASGGGSAPQSDDFNTSSLNTALWSFVNPVGNGNFGMTGTEVALTVPAGSNHDPSFGGTNSTARIIQRVSNTDFTVETKFDSIPSQQYTFEGMAVEQDASNYLRIEFGSTGSTLIVQAASVLSGNTTALLSATVTGATSSLWLRVQRQGATWTVSWSTNGSTYQTLGAFTQGLTVSGIGPYVGNYNAVSPPAFTATVDYFHSM